MIINPFDKAKLEKKYPGCEFKPIEGSSWEEGHTYFCGYWHEAFKVLSVQHDVPIWNEVYTVEWESGNITTHSTRPEAKFDFEIAC